MGNLIRKSPEEDKDEQLKRLQAEVDTLKTQMLGQRALIQGLAQEQGELRAMISQLPQGMKQPAQIRDQVMEQLPRGQRSGPMNRPLRVATTAQVQQRPRQEQRVEQNRSGEPKRQFTYINMSWSRALQHMLRMNLIAVINPPANPKTSSPNYNPEARCAYHSGSPRHDTEDCWALKYKIQNMIDAKEIEFEPAETPNVIIAPLSKHG